MSIMRRETKIERYQHNISNAFPTIMLLILFFLYITYDKCFHLLFRRMKYPMVARRRIIDGLWCSGFALSSLIYLKYCVPQSLDTACLSQKPKYLEFGFLLHKSFYLHHSIIEIFTHGCWLQGLTNLLFCVIINSSSEQRWFDTVSKLLFYKASVTAIINIYRVLLTLKNIKYKALYVRILLGLYLVQLIHVYSAIVPDFRWWNTHGLKNDWLTLICMWIWLFFEFSNEIYKFRLAYRNSSQWMDAYLFPPPTDEMIQLRNICRKLREPIDTNCSKKVAVPYQMILCAMIMKKRAKRMRERKINSSSINNVT